MPRWVDCPTQLSATDEEPKRPADAAEAPHSGTSYRGPTDAPESQAPRPRSQEQEPSLDADRFVSGEVIGRGGSSVVIRAFDRDIMRNVAIKILTSDAEEGASDVTRFTEEARITGQLEHPNIVPIYEYGTDRRGQRFLCMKVVEGKTLDDTLYQLGPARLDPERLAELLHVFVKVCDAISFAHSRGIIHRDLKPTNIMMSDFGQVYVLDWGVARRVQPTNSEGPRARELDPPGALIGTACYMAPEQLHGLHDKVDARADVFALGATLYQILTGRPPLTPEIVRALWLHKHPPAIAPPEDLVAPGRMPAELARIALRATSYDPTERHATVAELKRDVELFQRGSWDLPRALFPAGSIIIVEGEPGHEAFVIVEGRCVAYRVDGTEEVELRAMGPGDVFGETAVFSAKPRSASVKAVTDVVLLTVTSQALSSAVGLHSWMGGFVKALSDRFRDVDERLRSLEHSRRPSSSR